MYKKQLNLRTFPCFPWMYPSAEHRCRWKVRQTNSAAPAAPANIRPSSTVTGDGSQHKCAKPMRAATSRHFILFCFLLACLSPIIHAELSMELSPYEEACFVLRTHDKTRLLTGNYEMLNPNLSPDPLLVYIMENDKVVWHSKPGHSFDTFHAKCQKDKKYWLCIQNSSHGPLSEGQEPRHPDEETRKVGFNYRMHAEPKAVAAEWDSDKSEEWMDISMEIADDLSDMEDHIGYNKRREADHRSLVEKTFSDVLLWTLMEAAMVVLSALGQVLFYRRYLEKKQTYY